MTTTNVLLAGAIGAVLGIATGYWLWCTPEPEARAGDEAHATTAHFEPGKVDLDDDAVQDLGIRTAPLQAGDAVPTLRAPGRLQADPAFAATVRAPLAGRLAAGERPLPRLGAAVHRGDLLAVLTPRLTVAEQADLAQRRATAKADEASARLAVAAARADLERQRALHARDNAASQRAVDLAAVELATQEGRLVAAQEVLASLTAGAPLPIRLVAPFDGVADEVMAAAGEDVDAGAPLFAIRDPGHVVVRVEVGADAAVADTFAAARIELLTSPPRTLAVQFLGWADGLANDRALLLAVPEGDAGMRPGLPVVAHLPQTATPLAGLVVPETAIVRRGDGAYVFVRTKNHAGTSSFERRPVVLDAPVDGGWLVTQKPDGLAAGAELVTAGAGTLFSIERQRTADAESGG